MAVSVDGHDINGLGSPEGIDIYNRINIVVITGTPQPSSAHHARHVAPRGHRAQLLDTAVSVVLGGSTLASGLAFCGDNRGTSNGAPVAAMDFDLFDTFSGGNDFGALANFSIPAVPEPSSPALLASGLVGGLAALRRKIR